MVPANCRLNDCHGQPFVSPTVEIKRCSKPKIHVRKTRRKTVEACERCREKRTKCDGNRPCNSCLKTNRQCSLIITRTASNEHLLGQINALSARLRTVEATVERDGANQPFENSCENFQFARENIFTPSVTEFNRRTGCFEYYGTTSGFVFASSLVKRLRQLEDDEIQPLQRRITKDPVKNRAASDHGVEGLGFGSLLETGEHVMPLIASGCRYRTLQKAIADRHLENFFTTIHIYLPIFNVSLFWAKYRRQNVIYGEGPLLSLHQDNQSQQFNCLLYAVLALGALYSDNRGESSSWAAWYFSQAQEMLGGLLDAVNLELVQAVMFMGGYAQHTIKPNLAYNLVGTATRLAFSIGLNLDTTERPLGFDLQEAKRTWWMLYIHEVELSLESGRPMSIRSCDVRVDYPLDDQIEPEKHLGRTALSKVTFLTCLAKFAQVVQKIIKFLGATRQASDNTISWYDSVEKLNGVLLQWQQSLPPQFRFQDEVAGQKTFEEAPSSWVSRQRSSLRLHYNLALIVLNRTSVMHNDQSRDRTLNAASASVCTNASIDVVTHIHWLFGVAPSLRCWTYYCFYSFMATLALVTKIVNEPHTEETSAIVSVCELSVEIFQQLHIKAAQHCAEKFRRILDVWYKRWGQPKGLPNGRSNAGPEYTSQYTVGELNCSALMTAKADDALDLETKDLSEPDLDMMEGEENITMESLAMSTPINVTAGSDPEGKELWTLMDSDWNSLLLEGWT